MIICLLSKSQYSKHISQKILKNLKTDIKQTEYKRIYGLYSPDLTAGYSRTKSIFYC